MVSADGTRPNQTTTLSKTTPTSLHHLFSPLTYLNLSVDMRHPKTHSEVPHPEPVELPQGSIPRSIPDSTPIISPSDESNLALQICCCHFYRSPYLFQDAFVKVIQDDFEYSPLYPLAVPSDAQRNEQ